MAAKSGAVKTQVADGTLRLNPKGDLVASTVEDLRVELQQALDRAKGAVVLDLSATRQIDSLGITLVLGLFKSCQQKGLAFSIEGASADILRVFRLFNLTKFFPVKGAGNEPGAGAEGHFAERNPRGSRTGGAR